MSEDNKTQAEPERQESALTPESAAPTAAKPKRENNKAARNRSGAGAVAWLGLLGAIAALTLAGWMYWQDRAAAASARTIATDLAERVATSEQQTRAQLQVLQQDYQRDLARAIAALEARQQEQLGVLQVALQNQRHQLLELRHSDRDGWALAEADNLVRLAHQRILMARDARSALALLASADAIVQELDDAQLLPVRAALAADMAALRGVADVDIEGAWLRLQALAGEIDRLMLFRLPERPVEQVAAADADGEQGLEHGLRSALRRLSGYIVIRRRKTPYQALISPQWEGLVRQNMRMLLAQAQMALLAGNDTLYQASIAASRRWVGEFFALDEAAVQALDAELVSLSQLAVTSAYPDINVSLAAIKAAVSLRRAAAADSDA